MSKNLVDRITIGEAQFTIFLEGKRFTAEVMGLALTADSFDGLEEKIRDTYNRKKIQHAIPVILEGRDALDIVRQHPGFYYIRAILRGRNERTRQYLFTLWNDQKVSIEYPHVVLLGDDVTDAELKKLNELAMVRANAHADEQLYLRERRGSKSIIPSAQALLMDAEKAALNKAANI